MISFKGEKEMSLCFYLLFWGWGAWLALLCSHVSPFQSALCQTFFFLWPRVFRSDISLFLWFWGDEEVLARHSPVLPVHSAATTTLGVTVQSPWAATSLSAVGAVWSRLSSSSLSGPVSRKRPRRRSWMSFQLSPFTPFLILLALRGHYWAQTHKVRRAQTFLFISGAATAGFDLERVLILACRGGRQVIDWYRWITAGVDGWKQSLWKQSLCRLGSIPSSGDHMHASSSHDVAPPHCTTPLLVVTARAGSGCGGAGGSHRKWRRGGGAGQRGVVPGARRTRPGHGVEPKLTRVRTLIYKEARLMPLMPAPSPRSLIHLCSCLLFSCWGIRSSQRGGWRVVRVALLSSSCHSGGSCRRGPRGAASSGVELHDGFLAQIAVRVGAPALDLSTHQRVEKSHHAWILLDGLADVVVGQTTAAVEHQADVLLVGVQAAGLVFHSAIQVTETVRLLVGTPHLRQKGESDSKKQHFLRSNSHLTTI